MKSGRWIVGIWLVMGMASVAHADYKEKLVQDVQKIVQDFAAQEMGNRMSKYAFQGFVQELNKAFAENKIQKSVEQTEPEKVFTK